MNDLQLHISQLLREIDSLDEQIDEETIAEPVEKSKKKSEKKEKFLTSRTSGPHEAPERWLTLCSQRTLSVGKGTPGETQELEENEDVMHLLKVVNGKSIKDKKE